ncbi:MAG: hypothetical protein P8Z79_20285 [Sedimentisphaerales bacterium]|jgi:hypothetical protein
MDLSIALVVLSLLMVIGIWALYWTVWKIRNELIDGREKLNSEFAEIRKALESKSSGA